MIGTSRAFAGRLLRWYDRARRDLPWRVGPGEAGMDPWRVLVSETMLQQTQVATVVPYFHRFMARFPTPDALASADEQEVLRLWQGLGYYRRARHLRAAARAVVRDFGGAVPPNPDQLLGLPGVGRYTAGAVASIAFGRRAPILDGNVMRVLCRIDRIEGDPRQPDIQKRLWARAEQVLPSRRVGDFNSALMELGATVCSPRNPQCLVCPVRAHCEAQAAGVQDQIPPPRKARLTPLVRRETWCIHDAGRWLIEQRPPSGRWPGMWQFLTIDPDAGARPPCFERAIERLGEVRHALTHRRYAFEVFVATMKGNKPPAGEGPRQWVTLAQSDRYPMPRPHVRIREMLRQREGAGQAGQAG